MSIIGENVPLVATWAIESSTPPLPISDKL